MSCKIEILASSDLISSALAKFCNDIKLVIQVPVHGGYMFVVPFRKSFINLILKGINCWFKAKIIVLWQDGI